MYKVLVGLALFATAALPAESATAQAWVPPGQGLPRFHPPQLPPPYQARYFLGVATDSVPVNPDFVRHWREPNLGDGRWTITALSILHVAPNSAAQRAGLQPGDILLYANGIRLYSPRDLVAAIQASGGVLYVRKLSPGHGPPATVTIQLQSF
jgi:hypothetical protein